MTIPVLSRAITTIFASLALGACSLILPGPVERAEEAFAAQDYFAARDHVQEALEADAGNVAALELLARIQLSMGLGSDAIATLDRLEEAGAVPEDDAVLRAEALLQTGEREDALALLANETSAESWRLRALAAVMAGDPQGAARAFVNGRDALGDRTKLFTAAASFHLNRGDPDGARYSVRQAQELAPQSIETLFVTARLAQLDGNAELAARAFLAILDKSENDRPALLGAIAELDKIGRIDLIRPLVARGRAAYPGDVEFIYLDASVAAYDGNWSAARDLLQEHEALIAGHDNARGLYGQALFNLGQLELARAQLEPLVRRHPDNAAYARILADVERAAAEAG